MKFVPTNSKTNFQLHHQQLRTKQFGYLPTTMCLLMLEISTGGGAMVVPLHLKFNPNPIGGKTRHRAKKCPPFVPFTALGRTETNACAFLLVVFTEPAAVSTSATLPILPCANLEFRRNPVCCPVCICTGVDPVPKIVSERHTA